MTSPRRRTVAYTRVSSDEQRERQTILTQRAAIERWSLQTGTPIVEWVEDDGVSGTVPLADRPGGARLLALVADGLAGTARRVDEVVVYRLDRMGRDTIDVLRVVRDLGEMGTAVASVTEPLDASNPGGQFVLTVLAGAATFERQSIVQRSIEGSRRLARDGVWLGGITPYGYRVEGTGRNARLAPSEAIVPGLEMSEADVVRWIYRLASEGRPCAAIADALNARGVPPAYVRDGRDEIKEAGSAGKRTRRLAGTWSPGRIRNLLVNTTYRGLHRYGRRRGKKALPGNEVGIIERVVPALVDEDAWHAAREKLRLARLLGERPASTWHWLLRGLLVCEGCELAFGGTLAKGAAERLKRYYRCGGKNRREEYGRRKGRCRSKDLNADIVEGQIWADVDRFVRHPGEILGELAASVDADLRAAESFADEARALRRRLAEKAGERDMILSLFRRRRLPPEALDTQLDQIDREEAALRRQIEEIEARIAAACEGAALLGRARKLLDELHGRLGSDPPWEVRRELVVLLIDRIVVATTIDAAGRKHVATRPRYRFDRDPVSSARTGTRAVQLYGMFEREHVVPDGRSRAGRESPRLV